jgi:hypothetical protein
MSPIMGFLPQQALKDNFVVYFLGVVIARLQIDWSRIDVTVAQEQFILLVSVQDLLSG